MGFNNSSRVSIGKYDDLTETRCSFQNSSTGINWLGKKKGDESALLEEISQLKIDVTDLKTKLSASESDLNKWKKKAMKYSSKIKAVSKEQVRFENAY